MLPGFDLVAKLTADDVAESPDESSRLQSKPKCEFF